MLHSRAADPIVACKKKINIFYLINNKRDTAVIGSAS